MTMLTHKMRRTAALTAVAAGALMAPGTALASHDIRVYKVDKQVYLEHDTELASITCDKHNVNPSDHVDQALDGMWRIDYVEQLSDIDEDTPQAVNTLLTTGVDVVYAKLNAFGDGYDFKFNKTALGGAQLKVFVTCIEPDMDKSKDSSGVLHTHTIQWGTASDPDPGGPASWGGTGGLKSSGALVAGNRTIAGSCATGQSMVSPGFDFTTGVARPYMSYPTSVATNNNAIGTRTWGFVAHTNDDVTVTWRCLKAKLDAGHNAPSSENHKLVMKWRGQNNKYLKPSSDINDGKYDEAQAHCGNYGAGHDASKGMVSGWYIGDSTAGDSVAHVWYLGQDPRIKSRAFKLLADDWFDSTDPNPANWIGHKVTTGLICINDRTT